MGLYRYFFVLEYNGQNFCGWQRQSKRLSVQEAFEEALAHVTKKTAIPYAAGRTDAGVHATSQVVHVTFEQDFCLDRLKRGTNFYLQKKSLVVRDVFPVSLDQHARFSARSRSYTFMILAQSFPPVLSAGRVWWTPRKLCLKAMQEAAILFCGTHDFSAFRASECQANSPIKTLDCFDINQSGSLFTFHITARSFLHHQVRMMVGTLVKIGQGAFLPQHVTYLLTSKDKAHSGPLAPACGLYLTGVSYDNKMISSIAKVTF